MSLEVDADWRQQNLLPVIFALSEPFWKYRPAAGEQIRAFAIQNFITIKFTKECEKHQFVADKPRF